MENVELRKQAELDSFYKLLTSDDFLKENLITIFKHIVPSPHGFISMRVKDKQSKLLTDNGKGRKETR